MKNRKYIRKVEVRISKNFIDKAQFAIQNLLLIYFF